MKKMWQKNWEYISNDEGSTVIIALATVAILMTISLTLSTAIILSLRSTRNIHMANQAYFAAEGSVEEILYRLAGHDLGYLEEGGTGGSKIYKHKKSNTNYTGIYRQRFPDDESALTDLTNTKSTVYADVSLYNREKIFPSTGFFKLARGSSVTLGLYNENNGSYTEKNTTAKINDFDLKIALIDDGTSLDVVDSADTRVSKQSVTKESVRKNNVGVATYKENSVVNSSDLDLADAINTDDTIRLVDFDANDSWDPGEPVYIDKDSSGSVNSKDWRINTVTIPGCPRVYRPSVHLRDRIVKAGDCDTSAYLTTRGIDVNGDGKVDYGLGAKNTDLVLASDDLLMSAGVTGTSGASLEDYIINNDVMLRIYHKAPVGIVSLSATRQKGGEGIVKSIKLKDIASCDPKKLTECTTATAINSFGDKLRNLDTGSRPHLQISALQKGLLVQATTSDSDLLPKLFTHIVAVGRSGAYQQTLETTIQQSQAVPIFNYAITY